MTDSPFPRTIGKYEILSVLGQGGMGVVYQARDPLIDRVVAIKTLRNEAAGDPELLARLKMEARSAGRLQHPSIVTIYDFGQDGDIWFLAMEHVEGDNLARVINNNTEIPFATKVDIVIQLADGLAYAHDLGVIHRDIKPANICLTRKGDPKMLDFGLARFDETRLTRTGFTSGTVSYMSPERIRGESGPSDDVFALGVVAYEIFTYASAFPGTSYADVVSKILSGRYPKPPSTVAALPRELDALIARAAASDKKDRFASAHELAKAFRELRSSSAMQAVHRAEGDSTDTIVIRPGENPYSAADMNARMDPGTLPGVGAGVTLNTANPLGQSPTEKFTSISPDFEATTQQPVTAPATLFQTKPLMSAGECASKPESGLSETLVSMARTALGRAFRPARDKGAPPSDSTASMPGSDAGSFLGRNYDEVARTVVAPAVHRGPGTVATPAESPAPAVTEAVKPRPGATFYVSLAALAVAVAALPLTQPAGSIPYLVVLAVAAILWYVPLRAADGVSLGVVIAVTLAVRAVALVADVSPIAPSGDSYPPPYALLIAGVVGSGAVLSARLLAAAADLAIVLLLWDRHRPMRALGYATFPIVVVEGVWRGGLEPVAAALLVASYILVLRQRDLLSAVMAGIAAGVNLVALAAIPMIYGAGWKIFRFIAAIAAAVALPVIFLGGGAVWTRPIGAAMASSPLLSAATKGTEELFGQWNFAGTVNDALALLAVRLGPDHSFDKISNARLALMAIGLAVIVLVTIVAQRSRETEGAIANSLGLLLLILMAASPAAWLLVVPFAIRANRPLWLYFAVFAQLLHIPPPAGESINTVAYLASVILPVLVYVAVRVQQKVATRLSPVPVPTPSRG